MHFVFPNFMFNLFYDRRMRAPGAINKEDRDLSKS